MRAQGRKVLLLLDNFSGHELGAKLVDGKQGLPHVRVEWPPSNTTSCWQPMDQGVIVTLKLRYQKLSGQYILCQYEATKDPDKTVTLLKAIQWTRVAWAEGVSPTCVQRCWWNSTVLGQSAGLEIVEENLEADRDKLQKQINELPGIDDHLSVSEFIELGSDVVHDEDLDIFASKIERYSTDKAGIMEEAEEGDIETEKVSNDETLKAIDIVRL